MASFTRDWDEATPTDSNYAYEIDDYMRYLRVDVSDRIKDMVYGFTAGENDGNQGLKKATFRQQSSAPGTPNADEIVMYALDDGSNCGLYAKNEDGYTKQILKKSGTNLILNLDSNDTAASLGSVTVSGITASQDLDIGSYELRAQTFESDVATGTAPMTIASTTKVTNLNADKVDGYDVSAYAGEESYTFPGGLIFKHGTATCSGFNWSVTFAEAFTNGIVSYNSQAFGGSSVLSNISTANTTTLAGVSNSSGCTVSWQVWGY